MAEWNRIKRFEESRYENNNLNSTPGFLIMYTVKLKKRGKKGAESIMTYRAFSENAATPDINN